MVYIPDGCVLLARKIKKSDIWQKKPSWWLKVWNYMLIQVNHKDNPQFKRGQAFFTYEQIYRECHLQVDGIKRDTIDNVIRWMRQNETLFSDEKVSNSDETPKTTQDISDEKSFQQRRDSKNDTDLSDGEIKNTVGKTKTPMITTQKTTRGIIITICNYELYQNLKNYKNDAENDTSHEIKTRQKRDRNDTINNNDNNDKNDKNKDILSGKPDLIAPIEYLNLKTKSNFDPKNKGNQDLVRARYNEGRTLEQFKTVIDKKVAQWLNDEKMMQYLRPSTLFNRTKFENYLNEPISEGVAYERLRKECGLNERN